MTERRRHAAAALILCWTAAAAFVPAFAANPESPASRFALAPGAQIRTFWDHGPVSLYAEGEARLDFDSVFYNAVAVGLYWQPWDNLRVGAFYKRQAGVRHVEDWVIDGTGWRWQDVNGRAENLFLLDASPRWLMTFLPGERWMGELKVRWIHNFFNSHDTLLVRPGIAYFWQDEEGSPVLNFFLQYEADLALNYGHSLFAEHWVYLSAIRPVSPAVQLGLQAAFHAWNWSSTAFYAANTTPPSSFLIAQPALHLGAVAIFKFGE